MREFDKSNSRMQFGRNWVINDEVKVPQVQADHRQPFSEKSHIQT